MTSLLHLTLSRNTISQILPSAFSDLRRLRALHLDSNRLTVIKVRSLCGIIKVDWFSFYKFLIIVSKYSRYSSRIFLTIYTSIWLSIPLSNQDDHFKGLTNLRHLILANNQLHSISPHAFDDFVTTLEDLDLSYNNLADVPWDTIGRLTNVNTLNMDHNLIENVPQGVFTNLHKLAR